MDYSFDIKHAEKYGLHEAILLKGIIFWIRKNKSSKKHLYDGRTWTYNSRESWAALFPFLTLKQVRSTLENLRDSGVIRVGNYNATAMDRTLWYALQDENLLEFPVGPGEPIEKPEGADQLAPEGQSLILESSFSKKTSKKSKEPPSPTVPVVSNPVDYCKQLQARFDSAEEKSDGAAMLIYGLELLHGRPFANYPREWASAKRLIKSLATMSRGAGDLRSMLRELMRVYCHKRKTAREAFWKEAPLTPSGVLCRIEQLVSFAGKQRENQELDEISAKAMRSQG